MNIDTAVDVVNRVRAVFFDAIDHLAEIPSFRGLLRTSSDLEASVNEITKIASHRHLRSPCDGRITCAIVGSSGHGKTTIMDELFPALSTRGWLVTDVTDTTAQALRIEHAKKDDPDLDRVDVRSWDAREIKELMTRDDVEEQNGRDGIRVSYLADGVVVDGREANFDAEDARQFRFPPKIELKPFSSPHAIPDDLAADRKFIRSLTVKEQSSVMETGPILEVGGRRYHALELRALVKDVTLRDEYARLAEWVDDPEVVRRLTFVDTPGLAVSGSVKDEVLRHFLEKKSDHVALSLWRDDELDIVVHLVLCGRQSDFADLWKAIERECGPAEMEDLAERLVLAINGMNIYFTNRDVKAKYEDPERAAREGDQFATTVVDNVLEKMSPRGRLRPAKVCFLDSKSIVETVTTVDYRTAYDRFKAVMEGWVEPGGIGYDTLDSLGIVDDFKENLEALADPNDRGQGHLVRQVVNVAEERGPALLLRKHLVRTGLLGAMEGLRELLRTFYDDQGRLSDEAAREALRSTLSFLDADRLESIEEFASEHVDDRIESVLDGNEVGSAEGGWLRTAFAGTSTALCEAIMAKTEAPSEVAGELMRVVERRSRDWGERWGYREARLPPPDQGYANTRDLAGHCLRLSAREILYRLVTEDRADGNGGGNRPVEQTDADRQAVIDLLSSLEAAWREGREVCAAQGVRS